VNRERDTVRDGRLIVLAGPSCVGKSPLDKALARFHPELRKSLRPVVLYNDRAPRPGEVDGVDYHFRERDSIRALEEKPDYVVMDVRGDLQALDLAGLKRDLEAGDVFFEGNPFVGHRLLKEPGLADINRLGVFMAPLSRDEILYLRECAGETILRGLITDVMRRKLLRRTRKQKSELSLKDLENIETRAGSAFRELKMAHEFDAVLPNHDGEDSENWDAFYYPLGDARLSLRAFVALLQGEPSDFIERWEAGLIP
jgi:guanylate kinase